MWTNISFDDALNEVRILMKLKHENIVDIEDFDFCSTGNNEGQIAIFLEYANEGSLSNILNKGNFHYL